jgi:hypothetical protein
VGKRVWRHVNSIDTCPYRGHVCASDRVAAVHTGRPPAGVFLGCSVRKPRTNDSVLSADDPRSATTESDMKLIAEASNRQEAIQSSFRGDIGVK